MSSAFVQTLIGGALAIVGGLIAAWWQTSRSDDVAQRIRRAERYESALIELNARAAQALSQVMKVWQDARLAVLRGQSSEQIDASNYGLARQPLDDLLNHWHAVSSLMIPDGAIVDAFVKLHQVTATHVWHEGNVAYSAKPPIGGKADTTRFIQDLETVYLATNDATTQLRNRVIATHDVTRRSLLSSLKTRMRAVVRHERRTLH